MCGICGFHAGNDFNRSAVIKAMCSSLSHRGPDDEQVYSDGDFFFGHRRLSIIDLKTGRQPIWNEDNTVCVILNGEIFNFPELRADLEKGKHIFKTRSDTEVLVHLYEDFGTGMLRYLNGQFAFALFDKKERKIFAARDRLGQNPFYYYQRDDVFAFGSELKALLKFPLKRSIDLYALQLYFQHQFIPGDDSIYEGIKKLPPGSMLVYKAGTLEVKRYWEPRFEQGSVIPSAELTARAEDILTDAVKIRLNADVPLGTFLSGGLDSALITALSSEQHLRTVRTFTVDFGGKRSEAALARLVSEKYGTTHTEIYSDLSHLFSLEEVLKNYDEPFGDYSLIPTYYLCREVSKNVKVAVSGDGGDELFGGYKRYGAFLKLNAVLRFKGLVGSLPVKLRERIAPYLPLDFLGRYIRFISIFKKEELKAMLSFYIERNYDHILTPVLLNRDSPRIVDSFLYLPEAGLVKVDRAAMGNSLEVRTPFLDHRLVELMLSVPDGMNFDMFRTKKILRRIAAKHLPPELMRHPKQGFSPPLHEWYKNEHYFNTVKERVLYNKFVISGGLKRQFVEDLFCGEITYPKVHRIFLLHAFSVWMEQYGD
mgnify:CR=1 FL=1